MTTTTTTRPTGIRIAPTSSGSSLPAEPLAATVAAASDVIAEVALDDPRWDTIGPLLTAFVDAARRAAGGPGSPIDADESIAPVLRLRDLARLAQRAAGLHQAVAATAETTWRLRSLQIAALR